MSARASRRGTRPLTVERVAATGAERSATPHNRRALECVSPARCAAATAVVVLLLAGCGGSSGSPQRPFASAANAICANASKSLARVPAIGGTLSRLAFDVANQLPIYEKQLKQLSALKAPASKESAYATALNSARMDVTLLHRLHSAARAGNRTEVHEIATAGSSAYSVAGTAMRRIGLTKCATSL
jgi:hypothetical protein